MDSPLTDIAFLGNSENRVAVLNSLAEGPHSRHVLAEKTGISRVTLGRILDELEDRRWIAQRGQVSEITPLGAWVAEEFAELCEMMAAERKLREVIRWFPEEGYGFHVSHLADAEITALVRPFLENGDRTPEEVDRMYHAWFKSMVLQVTLRSYPYVKDGDW